MGSTRGRPLGVTLVALVVIFQGVFAIVVGLNLIRAIELFGLPPTGSADATGGAMILVGILGTAVGLGLLTMRFWAYVVALGVLGMTVLAGIFAIIQHGFATESMPSLVPAVISGVIFAYLFSERVRPYFDAD